MAPVWIKKQLDLHAEDMGGASAAQTLSHRARLLSMLHSYAKTPSVMPFFGNSVSNQPGNQMEPGSGFGPPPIRDRFGGWPPQPGDPGAINGLSSWSPGTPQGHGYIQQVPPHHPPPHQLDDLRHYHPQYTAAPSYQGGGYQQPFLVDPAQSPSFQQQPQAPQTPQTQLPYSTPTSQPPSSPAQPPLTPRSNYSQAHTPQPSPTQHQVNGINGNISQRNGVNGSYMEASPVQSMEYVNGTYTPSQENSMAPPQSTTPTSRSSSVHMDTGNGDSNGNVSVNGSSPHHGMNGNMNGRKTPSINSSAPGSGNAMPGYPLHQAPPQLIQQSLHNSSGYPGQEMSSGAARENGMSSPSLWNNSNASNSINNHQPNNNAGSANANGNTNASANRSVWNGGGQDRPPSALGHSPKMDASPQHQHYQHEQGTHSNSNNTSPVNSRLKTMILNKQQQQFNQQVQQFNQQMQEYNQQQQQMMPSPSGAGNGHQMMSPQRSSDHYHQQSQQSSRDSRPPSRQSPNPHQNSAGHFLVEGHHLQRSVIPEGGGVWEWGGGTQTEAQMNHVSAIENVVKFADLRDTRREVSNNNRTSERGPMGFCSNKKGVETDEDWSNEKSNHQNEVRLAGYSETLHVDERNKGNSYEAEEGNSQHFCGDHTVKQNRMNSMQIKEEPYLFRGDGGPIALEKTSGAWCCRQGGIDAPSSDHLKDGCCQGQGLQTLDEAVETEAETDKSKDKNGGRWSPDLETAGVTKDFQEHLDRLRNNIRAEVPDCDCFPPDKLPPEPGSYYTHLGAARTLPELRSQVEVRSGFKDKAVRIEKVLYSGKEGKTTQGCPLAKWIIRRATIDEKILAIVKYRQGHKCPTAWIVVALVAWEGIPIHEADHVYTLLSHKLNRFGLPTTRRCATNEPRTCACQGLDPNTCGASFSFGCSWSMYYNGCKYARSKTVRKFRLSVRSEEQEVEEKMHTLATLVSPLYESLVPEAFHNQTQFENEASDCRLGFKTGRPFSGVTACIDFCAHSHRDLHNMNNGCTVVVSLTKHRSLSKPDDEQLHVLPLYTMDDSDEYGSKEDQVAKEKSGAIETLTKFPCEVRVRSVPLQPCRRHGKKRGKEEEGSEGVSLKKDAVSQGTETANTQGASPSTGSAAAAPSPCPRNSTLYTQPGPNSGMSLEMTMEAQLQSSQVSSTVLDSPVSMYQGWGYDAWAGRSHGAPHAWMAADAQHWTDYNAALTRGPSLERVDADSTTAVSCRSSDSAWTGPLKASQRQEPITPHPAPCWDSSSCFSNKSQIEPHVIKTTVPCSKRIEPEEITSAPTGDSTCSNRSSTSAVFNQRLDDHSPSVDLPSSAFSSSSVIESGVTDHTCETDKASSDRLLKKSCWLEGNNTGANSTLTDSSTSSESSSLFRVPKARHASSAISVDAQNMEFAKDSGSWDSGSAFTSTGQLAHKSGDKSWTSGREAEECALSGGASKSLTFGSHGLKQESLFDDPKHPSDYQAYSASSNPSVVHAANPFACSITGTSPSYGYGYGPMFPDTKGYGAGWNDPFVDPHFNQFQGTAMNMNSLYGSPGNPYHAAQATGFMPSSMAPSYAYMPASRWDLYGPSPFFPVLPGTPKAEPIGEVTDFSDNEECFKDSQMGGVAIALGHGSVLFECAKHEMHATTALRRPNRLQPTRISLVFYQHRNLNRPKHGWDEWEEKMRLRKLGITTSSGGTTTTITSANPMSKTSVPSTASVDQPPRNSSQFVMRTPTYTTTTWTTLFPMHPCVVTGPYQESGAFV